MLQWLISLKFIKWHIWPRAYVALEHLLDFHLKKHLGWEMLWVL